VDKFLAKFQNPEIFSILVKPKGSLEIMQFSLDFMSPKYYENFYTLQLELLGVMQSAQNFPLSDESISSMNKILSFFSKSRRFYPKHGNIQFVDFLNKSRNRMAAVEAEIVQCGRSMYLKNGWTLLMSRDT